MTIVCNAGPVIALAKIDHLFLLRELTDRISIVRGYWLSDELLQTAKILAHE